MVFEDRSALVQSFAGIGVLLLSCSLLRNFKRLRVGDIAQQTFQSGHRYRTLGRLRECSWLLLHNQWRFLQHFGRLLAREGGIVAVTMD